jgi:hypothetical protein
MLTVLAPSVPADTSSTTPARCRLTHEQVVVMNVLEGVLADPLFLNDLSPVSGSLSDPLHTAPAITSLQSVVDFVCSRCLCPSGGRLEGVGQRGWLEYCAMEEGVPAAMACFTLLSSALSALSASSPSSPALSAMKQRVVDAGALQVCVGFLGQYRALKGPAGSTKKQHNEAAGE